MAALQIAVAAALGFAGAGSTSFVLPRGSAQAPSMETARVAGVASSQASGPSGAAPVMCASIAAGIAAAAVQRASRVPRKMMDRVNNLDSNLMVPQTTATDESRWRPFEIWGMPYKKSIYPDHEVDYVYEDEIIAYKPRVVANFAGGLVGSESAYGGVQQFDPIDFSGMYPEHVPWYREAELKHGRVAMLAMVGLIAQDTFRLPVPELQDPTINILNSHNALIYGLGQGPMWVLLVFCSLIESLRFKELGLDFGKLTHENAGDLNFGKGFLPKTEQGIKDMKLKELKNGRLAMLAFSGCITQAAFFGKLHFPYFG